MGKTINILLQITIILIVLFSIDYLFTNSINDTYDCGTGYTANITSHSCTLNTDTTITKSVPNRFIGAITWIQSILPIIGMICIIDSSYRLVKHLSRGL